MGVAACGSSSPHGTAASTSRPAGPNPTSAPTTTRPVTTTTHLNPAVADGFTQLALSNAIDAAQTIYHQSNDYTAVTPDALAPLVPKLHFGTIAQSNKTVVGLLAQDRNDVLLVMRSARGRWYCVTVNAMDGVSYGEGATRGAVSSNGECRQSSWPPPGKDQPAL